MLGIRVPDPDQVMLISGSGAGDKPFRIARARKFVMPVLNHVDFLRLSLKEANVSERCVTKQGIEITASAVCAFSIADDDESIYNAGKLFLSIQGDTDVRGRPRNVENSVQQIFAGHLREVVGGMTMEEVVNEREVLRKNVLEASKEEMGRLGLRVHSFQIQTIEDPSGYIENMSASARAAIAQKAKIAQSAAEQAAAQQEQASQRNQAEYARDTAIAKAGFEADRAAKEADAQKRSALAQALADQEVAVAQANRDKASQVANAEASAAIAEAKGKASQAGPLAEAQAAKEVTEAQTKLAEQTALLREQELEGTVVKPAQADAKKREILAKAESEATKLTAEAAAANDRVSLDARMIELWPEVMKHVSSGLAGANINILDGGEGLGRLSASLVGQGMAVFNQAREFYTAAQASQNGATTHVETELTVR